MRKLAVLLLAGVAFGVLVAVIKGQDTGVRDALGNTSAPWIVLPFVAGTLFSRARSAALAGLAVTLVSLLGFYLAEMDTAVRLNLPILFIVGNDAGWGLERELQSAQGTLTAAGETIACELRSTNGNGNAKTTNGH